MYCLYYTLILLDYKLQGRIFREFCVTPLRACNWYYLLYGTQKLRCAMRNFVREKKIYCGESYLEVDLYSLSEYQLEKKKGKRSKKKYVSLPKQEKMNDKNARRKFIQIAETNFGQDDIFLSLTYKDIYLPKSYDDAQREIRNYLRRLKDRMKSQGIEEELRYIVVTSMREPKADDKGVRYHHHLLLSCGLDRDMIEDCWRRKRNKGEKVGDPIGYANSKRIQEDANAGILGLANYLARHTTYKRRWSCSQNLERPCERTNDHKYSRKRLIQYALDPYEISRWEKIYKGYTIADKDNGIEAVYNDFTGWSIYLKLRRKIKNKLLE